MIDGIGDSFHSPSMRAPLPTRRKGKEPGTHVVACASAAGVRDWCVSSALGYQATERLRTTTCTVSGHSSALEILTTSCQIPARRI